MPRRKKSMNVKSDKVSTGKPVGNLKRGRAGPGGRAQILESAKAGVLAADLSAKFQRSEKVIQSVLNGTSGQGKAKANAKNGIKAKRGNLSKKQPPLARAATGDLNLRQIITEIVNQEVKKQLHQAFQ